MPNAVTPFAAGAKPAPMFQQALGAAPQESLAEGIGASYPVIHYTGKVWSLNYRGERKPFVRPDDGTPSSYLDVIILRQAHSKSKSYYPKWDPNSAGGERPICSSLDSIVPDDDVTEKQANACAICPRNVWKTNAEGVKTRECTDYKRLAVLVMPAQTKAMFGTPLMEPAFLRIPPASLNDLATFGEKMNAMGWHYSSYITRISFDPTKPHPKMVFEAVKGLTDAEAPIVLPLRDDPNALRITGEDKVAAISGAANPAKVAALTQQPAAPAPQQPAPAPQAAPKPDAGFLDLTPNAPAAAQTLTASPADVGETLESDAALDEEIKNLLSA